MTTLLVAATGGHLKQLHQLHRRISGVSGPFRWATFDNAHSRSLLAGEVVDYVHRVGERDVVNALRDLHPARRILRDPEVDTIVSTGSGVALPFFAVARAQGLSCHFVETAGRTDGPSLTGCLIGKIPGVHLYAQHPGWGNRWSFSGSVFDAFECVSPSHSKPLKKVVVTLGTYRGFSRLVRRLLEILPPDVDVLWQTSKTDTSGLGISAQDVMPEPQLAQAMREADAIVAHAGVGTVLTALEAGKCPVLVPRRASKGEAIDDHQAQTARELRDRGLSVSVEADELQLADLVAASKRRVKMLAELPPLRRHSRS